MKAFEKWDKNNKINYASTSLGELNVHNERRKAWRAALWWVRREAISSDERGDTNRTVIDRELNE